MSGISPCVISLVEPAEGGEWPQTTEDTILQVPHWDRPIGSGIQGVSLIVTFQPNVFLRNVYGDRFCQFGAPVIYSFATSCPYTLEDVAAGTGLTELPCNNNVSVLYLAPIKRELFYQEVVAMLDGGFHAYAFTLNAVLFHEKHT